MSIVYCAVVRRNVTILCEFSKIGNIFREVILRKLPMKNQESLDDYLFFSFSEEEEIVFVCLIKSPFIEPSSIQSESYNYFRTRESTPHSSSQEKIDQDIYINFLKSLKKRFYEIFSLEEIMNSYAFSLLEFLALIETEVELVNKKIIDINKHDELLEEQKISFVFDKNNQQSIVETKLRKNTVYTIVSNHLTNDQFSKEKKKINCFLYSLIALLILILIFCVVYLIILNY
jgi:hypothetical protein